MVVHLRERPEKVLRDIEGLLNKTSGLYSSSRCSWSELGSDPALGPRQKLVTSTQRKHVLIELVSLVIVIMTYCYKTTLNNSITSSWIFRGKSFSQYAVSTAGYQGVVYMLRGDEDIV